MENFRKSPAPQKVTTGRFEIERDGKVAYLEYTMTGSVLGLIHTEVPAELRGLGLASLWRKPRSSMRSRTD